MNRIKELRQKNNLTLKELGQKVGMANNTLSQYETGKREPKLETWQALANFFDVTVPYLQGIDERIYSLKFSTKAEAVAFIPNSNNYSDVNHLDENNNITNLEWTTHKNNLNYGTHNSRMAKTKIAQKLGKPVIQFDKNGNYLKRWNSAQECGRNGFNYRHVNECCKHERKTHAGFIWKYESEVISND